jgi:hypothetical protein
VQAEPEDGQALAARTFRRALVGQSLQLVQHRCVDPGLAVAGVVALAGLELLQEANRAGEIVGPTAPLNDVA